MRTYIIRRLLLIIPTLFLVTIVVFFSVRLMPGSLVEVIQAEMEGQGTVDPEEIERLLGMDKPIHVQYGLWMSDIIIHGDLGTSLRKGTPVVRDIMARLPVTMELGILGFVIALVISIPIGIYSAIRQDTMWDYIGRSFAIACIAVPGFWLGTMIMVFPSLWWEWSPPMMWVGFTVNPIENLRMVIIPSALLGMALSGVTMRMLRTTILDVLRQDYVRTAWAKGLREKVVITRHVMKNALIPVVTLVGVMLPSLVGGSVVLEQIFCLPGLGRLLLQSLSIRDYTMVSGINLFFAVFVLLVNVAVDLTYSYFDPRVRYR